MSRIPKSDWEWFGHAAHFICGHRCRFHLATKVGDYIVSTVGEMTLNHNDAEFQEIGCDRKYETMVFCAGTRCDEPSCNCGLPRCGGAELDASGYNNAGDATRGHYAMCAKWAKPSARKVADNGA